MFTIWRVKLTQFNNSFFIKGPGYMSPSKFYISMLCPLCLEEVTKTPRDMKSLLLFLNLGCLFSFLLTLGYY